MKLLFKQKLFSWIGSYDIFDEAGETVYTVNGELGIPRRFRVYDAAGNELGLVKRRLLHLFPRFDIFIHEEYIGCIAKEITWVKPKFEIDFNGWQVEGDWLGWDYRIYDSDGKAIASVAKEIWNWTDTYSIDVEDPQHALAALLLVIAIDAEKSMGDD